MANPNNRPVYYTDRGNNDPNNRPLSYSDRDTGNQTPLKVDPTDKAGTPSFNVSQYRGNSPNDFCSPDSAQSYPKWTLWDFIRSKFLPARTGGGKAYLISYKDSWIVYNKSRIQKAAKSAKIPVDLLAGVAWIETGGAPDFLDSYAYPVRSFDWSGPDWIDKHLTITKHPYKTSFGSVSIQLLRAAETMGINLDNLDYGHQIQLCKCLETDVFNLDIVAKHLSGLIKYDFPNVDTENLTDEEIVVVGSRYNRGTDRKLEDFINSLKATPGSETRKYTEYGRTILRHRERIRILLLKGK